MLAAELRGRALPPCQQFRLRAAGPAGRGGGSSSGGPAAQGRHLALQQRHWGQQRQAVPALRHRPPQQLRLCVRSQQRDTGGVENRELLVGDFLCLVCFALYKQITALIFLPSFPGWLAPLAFNPDRFSEFAGFAGALCGSWVATGLLVGGYTTAATADLGTALARTCRIWLVSMPVSAAQLVLVMALEGRSLVGTEDWADALPLAASGVGEPFVTAAGVLGLMSVWRAFYTTYLDIFHMRSLATARGDRQREMQHFVDALRSAMLLSLACCVVLQFLGGVVGEARLEELVQQLGRWL